MINMWGLVMGIISIILFLVGVYLFTTTSDIQGTDRDGRLLVAVILIALAIGMIIAATHIMWHHPLRGPPLPKYHCAKMRI
jgi:multisubunit Na+/H+ antiporter MnhB subunit